MSRDPHSLAAVRVEGGDRKIPSKGTSDFVYVNSAYVGSVNNVNSAARIPVAPPAPITDVYREQYWACSRWPYTQRVLAITVGILLGALIGLTLSLTLTDKDETNIIGPIFQRASVPD